MATPYPFLAPLLAALAAIGPFAIDTYLPAFASIADSLGATQLEVQQTLTAFLLPFAFMTLWHGALADALGRRRVILWSLLLFMLASLACAAATRIEHLWIARALQGLSGGAGMVIGRAIIRDVLQGPEAQRMMSHVAMMFGIAPAVAPIIGGWIYTVLGWRSVFGFLVLFAAVLLGLSYRYLPETLPREQRQSLHPISLGKSYWRVFTRAEFLLLAGTVALNFNGFFLYVLSAPVFLLQHLGVSPHAFAWMFVPTVAGMMTGSYLSGRLAGRLSQRRTIALGFCIMIAAVTLNAGINWVIAPGVPHSILPIVIYNVGMALAMPSLTLLILELFPEQRGLVSSCQGFVHGIASTVTSAAIVPLIWATTVQLSLGMGVYAALGLAAFCAYIARHRARRWQRSP